jgi:hypothetical protein
VPSQYYSQLIFSISAWSVFIDWYSISQIDSGGEQLLSLRVNVGPALAKRPLPMLFVS